MIIRNANATNIALRKVAVSLSLADSIDLRIILSVLYIMTEVIRYEKELESDDFKQIVENFTYELSKYTFYFLYYFSNFKWKN